MIGKKLFFYNRFVPKLATKWDILEQSKLIGAWAMLCQHLLKYTETPCMQCLKVFDPFQLLEIRLGSCAKLDDEGH